MLVGFEIHQELSGRKLFCPCKCELSEEILGKVERRLHISESELGTLDRAARFEIRKGLKVIYEITPNSCLVELDEEPPHQINRQALKTAIKIALALNCSPIEEIHVMRKIVVDGSNPSGFQRTALIARNGFLQVSDLEVPIATVCIEEESARLIKRERGSVVYRLDRLGIPLVEIATEPVKCTPEEAMEIARSIGTLMRQIGGVRRGIGSVRQDVNVSIPGGSRVEIKGAQELELLPKIIELEVLRQKRLLKLKEKVKNVELRVMDVTELFSGCRCRIIARELEKGGRVFAMLVKGFKGLLGFEIQPGRRFGTELADHAKLFGLGGIIHDDEPLAKYGIEGEVARVRRLMKAGPNDAIIILAGPEAQAREALKSIKERIIQVPVGVPQEVRRVLSDGTTAFMRPMPGAARMYPETDLEPYVLTRSFVEQAKKELEERMSVLEEVRNELGEYGERICVSKYLEIYLEYRQKVEPRELAIILIEKLPYLRRKFREPTEEELRDVLDFIALGFGQKEFLAIMEEKLEKGGKAKEIAEKLGIRKMSDEEIEKELRKLKKEGFTQLKSLVSEFMRRHKGVRGKRVVEIARRIL